MSLEYKGYVSGPISFDDGVFSAVVEGLSDVIHFEGQTAEELEQAFHDSIDDYLDMCKADGVEPDRAFSGQFMVRTDSKVHRNVALRAAAEGKSLNQWVSDVLKISSAERDSQTGRFTKTEKASRDAKTKRAG